MTCTLCCGLIGPNSFGAMPSAQNTMLIDLCPDDPEYVSVEDQLQNSVREHKDNCGGIFTRYNIVKVCFCGILQYTYGRDMPFQDRTFEVQDKKIKNWETRNHF